MALVAELVAQWLAEGSIEGDTVPLFLTCRAAATPHLRRRLREERGQFLHDVHMELALETLDDDLFYLRAEIETPLSDDVTVVALWIDNVRRQLYPLPCQVPYPRLRQRTALEEPWDDASLQLAHRAFVLIDRFWNRIAAADAFLEESAAGATLGAVGA